MAVKDKPYSSVQYSAVDDVGNFHNTLHKIKGVEQETYWTTSKVFPLLSKTTSKGPWTAAPMSEGSPHTVFTPVSRSSCSNKSSTKEEDSILCFQSLLDVFQSGGESLSKSYSSNWTLSQMTMHHCWARYSNSTQYLAKLSSSRSGGLFCDLGAGQSS